VGRQVADVAQYLARHKVSVGQQIETVAFGWAAVASIAAKALGLTVSANLMALSDEITSTPSIRPPGKIPPIHTPVLMTCLDAVSP
jgi:hypothetical protein